MASDRGGASVGGGRFGASIGTTMEFSSTMRLTSLMGRRSLIVITTIAATPDLPGLHPMTVDSPEDTLRRGPVWECAQAHLADTTMAATQGISPLVARAASEAGFVAAASEGAVFGAAVAAAGSRRLI